MSASSITLSRSIFSYSKVQLALTPLIRGNSFFIKKNRIKDKALLNVGCGQYPKDEFINLDYSWRPYIDVCWDITAKRYPFPDSSIEGIFTEHCLEHIPFEKVIDNLNDFYRLLKPGGTIRIVVPDGQIYLDLYQQRKNDRSVVLPYGEEEETPIISINRIFRSHGHLFIYDFETLGLLLKRAGFINIKKESFQKGRDPRLLIDRPEREVESLYVEATK